MPPATRPKELKNIRLCTFHKRFQACAILHLIGAHIGVASNGVLIHQVRFANVETGNQDKRIGSASVSHGVTVDCGQVATVRSPETPRRRWICHTGRGGDRSEDSRFELPAAQCPISRVEEHPARGRHGNNVDRAGVPVLLIAEETRAVDELRSHPDTCQVLSCRQREVPQAAGACIDLAGCRAGSRQRTDLDAGRERADLLRNGGVRPGIDADQAHETPEKHRRYPPWAKHPWCRADAEAFHLDCPPVRAALTCPRRPVRVEC